MKRRLGGRLRTSAPTSSSPAPYPSLPLLVLSPGWGRLEGCVLQASPLRGEAVERSETDEGADDRTPGRMISAPTPKMYTIPVGAAVLGGPPDRPTHPAGAAPCFASRAAEDIRPYNTHNIRSSYAVGRDDPARLVVTITPPHPSSPTAMPPSPLWVEGLEAGKISMLTKLTLKEISSC